MLRAFQTILKACSNASADTRGPLASHHAPVPPSASCGGRPTTTSFTAVASSIASAVVCTAVVNCHECSGSGSATRWNRSACAEAHQTRDTRAYVKSAVHQEEPLEASGGARELL